MRQIYFENGLAVESKDFVWSILGRWFANESFWSGGGLKIFFLVFCFFRLKSFYFWCNYYFLKNSIFYCSFLKWISFTALHIGQTLFLSGMIINKNCFGGVGTCPVHTGTGGGGAQSPRLWSTWWPSVLYLLFFLYLKIVNLLLRFEYVFSAYLNNFDILSLLTYSNCWQYLKCVIVSSWVTLVIVHYLKRINFCNLLSATI